MATGTTATTEKDTPAKGKAGGKAAPPAKPTPAAKLPENAGKISGAAARRMAHGADPRTLKTLALLDAGNFEAPAIAKAIGHPPGDIDAHLDTLRRAKLVGVDREGGVKTYHLTDDGRKLWHAAKAVAG